MQGGAKNSFKGSFALFFCLLIGSEYDQSERTQPGSSRGDSTAAMDFEIFTQNSKYVLTSGLRPKMRHICIMDLKTVYINSNLLRKGLTFSRTIGLVQPKIRRKIFV